jgi:hypothetical protein
MTEILETKILEIWNKHSDPSDLTKKLHQVIEKENIQNPSQLLSQIFIKTLSKGFIPSEYLSTLLKHCISSNFIPLNVFFEELSKNKQIFKKENFIFLCFSIFEEFLSQMTLNKKRKLNQETNFHYELFLFKFLEFNSDTSMEQEEEEENENLEKCFELLERLNLEESILKNELKLIKHQNIYQRLEKILQKQKNLKQDYSLNGVGNSLISLELFFRMESCPIFIDHFDLEKSKKILKSIQQFKRLGNVSFLFQIWMNVMKSSDDFLSQLFSFWKLPKMIQEMFPDSKEIEESFELFSTYSSLNFSKLEILKSCFQGKTEITIQSIDQCIELLKGNNVKNQDEIIHFIELKTFKDSKNFNILVQFLNDNQDFLDFFQFHGKISSLIDILLKNMIGLEKLKTGPFSDYFKLLFAIVNRYDLLKINHKSFAKLLKQNSQKESHVIGWFFSLLHFIPYDTNSSIFNSLNSEITESKYKKYTFGEIISSNYQIIDLFKNNKDLIGKYCEFYGPYCEIISKYSLSKLKDNEEFLISKRFHSLDLQEDFKKILKGEKTDLSRIASIYEIIGIHKFIKLILQEINEVSSNSNEAFRAAEVAGCISFVIGPEGVDYLLNFIQIYISKFGDYSTSHVLAYFLKFALKMNSPSDKILENFNEYITDLIHSESSACSTVFAQSFSQLNF